MRFLVDAQLPARLARFLTDAGHAAVHTSELPNGNATPDSEINRVADADDRVVVTKDRDFRDSHLLRGTPRHLLVVTTGNITNDDLPVAVILFRDDRTGYNDRLQNFFPNGISLLWSLPYVWVKG